MAVLKSPSIPEDKGVCHHGQVDCCIIRSAVGIFAEPSDRIDPGRCQGWEPRFRRKCPRSLPGTGITFFCPDAK